MDILVLGVRGFPGVIGGIETHCEHLYPLLVRMGCGVEVVVRSSCVGPRGKLQWRGVRFHPLRAPRPDGWGTLVQTIAGLFHALMRRPDILHIHGIGPSAVTPIARFMGLRVIVTHHGPDYQREKWGRFARLALRVGELLGTRYAHKLIAVSEGIARHIAERCGRTDVTVIKNGVGDAVFPNTTTALERYNLQAKRYILAVGRLVPEKRQLDVIQAFAEAALRDWKLVVVGSAEPESRYSKEVVETASRTPGVVMTGFQTGDVLNELYANAGLFVLSSSYEGLPIVLLEAMSYGLPVLASRIPAHLDMELPSQCYFGLGDVAGLADRFRALQDPGVSPESFRPTSPASGGQYDWSRIAALTKVVYESALSRD